MNLNSKFNFIDSFSLPKNGLESILMIPSHLSFRKVSEQLTQLSMLPPIISVILVVVPVVLLIVVIIAVFLVSVLAVIFFHDITSCI
ncbi:MAG: hypothetical protein ACOYIF_06925 [Acetivibrionales bacterium]|jgi:hypothetical protein